MESDGDGRRDASVSRRALVKSFAGVGTAVSLGGCSLTRTTKLGKVSVVNSHHLDHRVRIAIRRNGEERYENTFAIRKLPHGSANASLKSVVEPWMRNPGRFEISATLLDGSAKAVQSFPAKRSGDCYGITVNVRSNEEISIAYGGHFECEEPRAKRSYHLLGDRVDEVSLIS